MLNPDSHTLLEELIKRGDEVSVINGVLSISPYSKKPVPEQWLKDNEVKLACEIGRLLSIDVFQYASYSTGEYGKRKSSGLTLKFLNVETAAESFVVFNAELKRTRNVGNKRAGQLLPKGQFRVTKNTKFFKWWLTTGLKTPPRLSSFHSYMGNLKKLFFALSVDSKGKITDKSLPLLSVSHENIASLLGFRAQPIESQMTYNSHTTDGQLAYKAHTRMAYKETPEPLVTTSLQPILTTGCENYVNTLIRKGGYKEGKGLEVDTSIKEVNNKAQTSDEWLIEYDNAM